MAENLDFAQPEGRPPARNDDADNLGDLILFYWDLLRRYWWVVAIAVCLAMVAGFLWTRNQDERFQAKSKIIYHKPQGNIFGQSIEQVKMLDPGGRWEFDQFWNTQKQVFDARWFGERVVRQVGLLEREGFVPRTRESGETIPRKTRLDMAIGKVLGLTSVRLERNSRVAVVRAESGDPELASTIANATAEAYISYTDEYQSGGLNRISSWFDEYVASKRKELEKAQAKLQEFKRKNNILSMSYEKQQSSIGSRKQSVNEKLVEVRNELSSQRALLSQLRQMQESDQDRRAIASLVENESLKTALRRESELESKLSQLKAKYLDRHPEVQAVSAELETVRDNIEEHISRIQQSVQNRVSLLQKKRQNYRQDLDSIRSELFELDKLGQQYNQLTNRKENLKELYDTVLKRASELNINSSFNADNIEILERATVPETPFSPSLTFNLAIALFMGLGLGTGTVLVLESLDTTVKSHSDVEEIASRPVLADLPVLKKNVLEGLDQLGDSPADLITHLAPKSSFSEGMKRLRTNLTFMSPDEPARKLLVTSSSPKEGKTTVTTNLGIASAQSGLETLLVGTDMRRPRLHKAFGLENDLGVTTAVTSDRSPLEFVQNTVVERLDVLPSGEVPPNPSELIHSSRFEEVVDVLGKKYDRVIFDSPPLAAVSDSLVLSQIAEGVLLVLEAGKTRREVLERSVEQLEGVGAPFLGFVFNKVSVDERAYYGYSSYGDYSYYGEDEDDRESPTSLAG